MSEHADDPAAFGFRWGPMTVRRIATYEPRKNFRAHILGIKTDRADVQVYVTPTGKVRVWRNGTELTTPPRPDTHPTATPQEDHP